MRSPHDFGSNKPKLLTGRLGKQAFYSTAEDETNEAIVAEAAGEDEARWMFELPRGGYALRGKEALSFIVRYCHVCEQQQVVF